MDGLPDVRLSDRQAYYRRLRRSARVQEIVAYASRLGLTLEELEALYLEIKGMSRSNHLRFLRLLVHPEREAAMRVPLTVPLPTAKFTFHTHAFLTPNADGYAALIYHPRKVSGTQAMIDGGELTANEAQNPYLLAFTNDALSSSGWAPADVDGAPPVHDADSWLTDNIGTFFEAVAFRGGGIYVRLNVPEEVRSGIVSSCSDYHFSYLPDTATNTNVLRGSSSRVENGSHSFNAKVSSGLRHVMMPLDEDDLKFYKPGNIHDERAILMYFTGVPIKSDAIRIDFYRHFEAIVFDEYVDLMSRQEPYHLDMQMLKQALHTMIFNNPRAICSTLERDGGLHAAF